MSEITHDFVIQGKALKKRCSHAQNVINSLNILGNSSIEKLEMYKIISDWEVHSQTAVNKLSDFLPFLFEDFAKNKDGTLLGTYFRYDELLHKSKDKNFNENCIVIKIGIEHSLTVKDGISTGFVYDFIKNEFFIWSYIGTDGIYSSKNYNREYIREQIRSKVPVKVIWNNK